MTSRIRNAVSNISNPWPFVVLVVVMIVTAIAGAVVFTGWAASWFWLAWLSVSGFFVIEFLAIFRKNRNSNDDPDTLTSHIQAMTRRSWIRDVAAGVIIGFAVWFLFHLWQG